jgi:diaminopimelate decarboxylase
VQADRPFVATIAGKHCEQGDLLVRDAALPADVAIDDVVAIPVTGAYGHCMASNYNKVPRPAVVFVRDGAARVVVRRETFDDLVRLDR